MKTLKHLWLAGFLLMAAAAHGQQKNMEDVVYLKNGSVLRGRVLSHEIGKSLKIQIVGGSIFVYPTSEIEKIGKEEKIFFAEGGFPPLVVGEDKPAWLKPHVYKTKGFAFYPDASFQFGRHPIFRGSASLFVGAHLAVGYHFTPKDFVGLASGIEGYFESALVPVQVQYRRMLVQDKPTQPYLYANAGYASAFMSEDSQSYYNKKGGMAAGFGAGFKFNTRGAVAYTLSLGYRYQRLSMTAETWDWQGGQRRVVPMEMNFGRADLRFGIAF